MIKSFHFNTIARIILIVLLAIYTGWSFSNGKPIYNSIALVLILIFQVINLIFYINRVNKKINYFFEAIKNEDFGFTFPTHKGDKILNKLSSNLKRINDQIQRIQIENLRQEQYFGALIEHVETGILSVDKEGFIIHANSSLKKLLGMNQFTHLRQLEKVDANLAKSVVNIRNNGEELISFNGKNSRINLLIRASAFKSNDQILTLISMQDIKKELDEKELDSWLKLIRVLTHEIMNSITPVTSLSENLCSYYIREGEAIPVEEVNEKMIQMTIQGLKVIREQGKGLTRFVESYRELTRLPKPEKAMVRIRELFEKTVMLFKSYQPCRDISISYTIDDYDLELYIDENQISQVLINLMKNSAEALLNTPKAIIKLTCKRNEKGKVELSVIDNGPGIPPELMDEIFVPFFTTRENGSGIGLSLSRQILRLNNGSLRVNSVPGKETVFTMLFD